jgi:uncharacterized membrane protein YfcA
MHLLLKILIGTLVGTLVGLTGLGGGVLLLPILIFGLGVPALIAVGSDAAFNALTKIGAGLLHWHRGTVNWRLVSALSLGSIPGAACGVLLLARIRSVYGGAVNDFLKVFIGVLLIGIPLLLLFQRPLEKSFALGERLARFSFAAVSALGLFAGILVGMTSVGSGSIVMVLLLLFTPCSPAILVGTDIIHAFVLTGFTSFLHLRLGTVDSALVLPLVIGSVPGSLLGVRLSTVLPSPWLKRVLCIVLLATGARMLGFAP